MDEAEDTTNETQEAIAVGRTEARRVRFGLIVVFVAVCGGGVAAYLALPDEEASATRPPRSAEATPVRVTALGREDLELTVRYSGELHAEAAEIAARTAGVLNTVEVRIGDAVEEGQLLGQVDTAQLVRQLAEFSARQAAAEASRRRIEAELGAARSELERTEPLLTDRLVSAQEVTVLRARVQGFEAETAAAVAQGQEAQARLSLLRQQIRDARLVAPFDGAVAERHLDPGAVVTLGTPVLRVVRTGPLQVRFRAPEHDLGRLEPGLQMSITTRATGDAVLTGRIERLSAAVSPEDRTIAVEGILDEEHDTVRPGMYVEITLRLGVLEDALVLPGQAVLERPGPNDEPTQGVFVVDDGVAHWTPVQIAGRSGDRFAVEGLDEGATVVTIGNDTLRDGAGVRVASDATP